MRRAPRFSRSRRRDRRRRIARSALIAGGVLVGLGVLGRLLDPGDSAPGRFDTIRFVGSERSEGAPDPGGAAATREVATEIRRFLDEWYTAAFADPGGDPTLPGVADRFTEEATLGFVEDRSVFSLGDLAPRVLSLTVATQRANVVVYFEEGDALAATAAVTFEAQTTLRGADAPVAIEQRVHLVFERQEDRWVVTNYYDAVQRQESIQEQP